MQRRNSPERERPILGGKHVILIMDVKRLAAPASPTTSTVGSFSLCVLCSARNLIPPRIYAGHEVPREIHGSRSAIPGGYMKIEWDLSRVSPTARSFLRSLAHSAPVGLLSRAVRRELLAFRRERTLTFSGGNAPTRTILSRLRRASCSTGSSPRIAPCETMAALERARACVAENFRQVPRSLQGLESRDVEAAVSLRKTCRRRRVRFARSGANFTKVALWHTELAHNIFILLCLASFRCNEEKFTVK